MATEAVTHGDDLLRDFRGLGRPGPWIGTAAVAAGSLAYAGTWTAWHDYFALAVGSHAFAYALLGMCRKHLESTSNFSRPLAVAVLGCLAGGLVSAALLRAVQGTWQQPWGPWIFNASFGVAFAAATILPLLIARRAEELRRRRTAEEHGAALQRETDRKRALEMELKALQAQIEPHFLYNTLANVQHLLRHEPDRADQMLESLTRYLKSSLPNMRDPTTTVEDELARAQAYLAIMQVRMQTRLAFRIDVSEAARARSLPPMSVLTLVENAVKHGLEPRPEGGTLHITGDVRDGVLSVAVKDDGVGFRSDLGTGIGLTNLRSRLLALHGGAAELELVHAAGGGVEATLKVPAPS